MTDADLTAALARLEAKLDELGEELRRTRRSSAKPQAGAVSLSRAARILGVSRGRTLPELVASGALKTVEIAGKVRVPRAELERVLSEGLGTRSDGRGRRKTG